MLLFWDRGMIIIWFDYVLWDWQFFSDDSWAEDACPLETIIFLTLLFLFGDVAEFVYSPIGFEALLRAEIGWIDIHFDAGGALHGCNLAASRRPALLLIIHSVDIIYY